jgi:hypothetical protein
MFVWIILLFIVILTILFVHINNPNSNKQILNENIKNKCLSIDKNNLLILSNCDDKNKITFDPNSSLLKINNLCIQAGEWDDTSIYFLYIF